MDHTRNIVIFLLFTLFTLDLYSPPIVAVSSENSDSDHNEHNDHHLKTKEDNISWNKYLQGCLAEVWDRNNPELRGHAEKMYNDWSANFSHYGKLSKESLRRTARRFILEGEVPLETDEQVKRQEARIAILKSRQHHPLPADFKANVNEFLNKITQRQDAPRERICKTFLRKYPEHAGLHHGTMNKYINRMKRKLKSKGDQGKKESTSRSSHDQPPQRTVGQDHNASSSQISNPEPDFQKQLDPHQRQSNYFDYIQSGMFVPPLRISKDPQTHQFLEQLPKKGSYYLHGESSSQTPRLGTRHFTTSGPDNPSITYYKKSRHSRGDGSETSSSQGRNDNLDLDLHL